MDRRELLDWLRESDERRLAELWRRADAARRAHVGDAVHLRGLIEISNHCVRECAYCGLRAPNRAVERYRMSPDEILACARLAVRLGYGTVVLQAGEDPQLTQAWVADVVRRIRAETPLAITLSLGEQDERTLRAWKAAGADRYLLRFETSNVEQFGRIHPPRRGNREPGTGKRDRGIEGSRDQGAGERGPLVRGGAGPPSPALPSSGPPSPLPRAAHPRLAILRTLRALGYEVGSGVMIGIPGQTYDDLADDLELFRALDLDMIGVGPFLPHPQTPLGGEQRGARDPGIEGSREDAAAAGPSGENDLDPSIPCSLAPCVRNSELMTYKVIALARLLCPRANIPSTTALATLNRDSGRELGLMRGANIVMPNLTPPAYRCKYEIYPAKACLFETAEQCHGCLTGRIRALGRTIGAGPGPSPNWLARTKDHRADPEIESGSERGRRASC